MLTLTITRIDCNLRNGEKKQIEVFCLTHKSAKIANDILQYLLDGGTLEGGDVITCKRGTKIVRQFTLCNICCKHPTVTGQGSSCMDCVKTIKKVTGGPEKNNSVVKGIVATLKSRQPLALKPPTLKKPNHAQVEIKSEHPVQFTSGFSFLRNSFQ